MRCASRAKRSQKPGARQPSDLRRGALTNILSPSHDTEPYDIAAADQPEDVQYAVGAALSASMHTAISGTSVTSEAAATRRPAFRPRLSVVSNTSARAP
jgi:hypothetical protein